MNWLDVLILLPLLVGLVRGLMRGLISEIIAFVVVILGVLGSRFLAPPFSKALLHWFEWPKGVCDIVAYVLIFLAVAVVLSIIARLLVRFLRAIHLSWANRLLGGIFGVLKYGILVLIAVFVMDKSNEVFEWQKDEEVVRTSVLYPPLVDATRWIRAQF
jgi:membrane protein required for colicin V production